MILITGAAGYVGSALVDLLLKRGHSVCAIDLAPGPLLRHEADPLLDFYSYDARDLTTWKHLIPKADTLIPLAALVGQRLCAEKPALAEEINLKAVEKLNQARGGCRTIFLTTDSGYSKEYGHLVDETTPMAPASLYAKTKCAAERVLLATGNCVSFRLGSVFGVSPAMRADLLLHFLVRCAVAKESAEITDCLARRSFIHLYDVIQMMVSAIDGDVPSGIYNLASHDQFFKGDVTELVGAAAAFTGFSFTERSADADGRNFWLDTRKLFALPRAPSLAYRVKHGLPALIRYYRWRTSIA